MRTAFVDVGDGVTLRLGHWPGPQAARGSVLLLQGRTEFLEKYEETARDLIARRFHVFAFDWRGQGLSSRLLDNRLKGHVGRFEDYLHDLRGALAWMEGAGAAQPIWVLAHSVGAHLALRYLTAQGAEDGPRIAAGVLLAPMLGLGQSRTQAALMAVIARSAAGLGLSRTYAIGQADRGITDLGFDGNPLTTDRNRFEEHRRYLEVMPDVRLGGVTWGWLDAAMRSIRHLNGPDLAQRAVPPLLIAVAGGDRVVRNTAVSRVASRLPNARILHLAESAHEILRERDAIRAQCWRAVDDFLDGIGV